MSYLIALQARLTADEREANRKAQAKREAEQVAAGIAETVGLDEARGEVFTFPQSGRGEGVKPRRRKDGLDWLFDKGVLGRDERNKPGGDEALRLLAAGRQYGENWKRLYAGGGYRCALNDTPRGGNWTPGEARARDIEALDHAMNALGHAGLITLMNRLCGQDEKLSEIAGNEPDTRRLEGKALVALDKLVIHYGIGG